MLWWNTFRDLVLCSAVIAGYAWLTTLSLRTRALHRRLAIHCCNTPTTAADPDIPTGHTTTTGGASDGRSIPVADLLLREQHHPQQLYPAPPTRPPPPEPAEQTTRLPPIPTTPESPDRAHTPGPGHGRHTSIPTGPTDPADPLANRHDPW